MRKHATLIAMLVIAACSGSAPPEEARPVSPPAAAADAPVAPASPAPAATAPAPQSDAAPANAPAADAAPTASLAVEGEGLRAFNLLTGSARPMPFGSARADTLGMLRAVLGREPDDQGTNPDCGADYARWDKALTAWFTDEKLVGWSLPETGSTLTTASGIGVGSTRGELESAYSAQVAPSSLGVEFTAGDLAGLLDSDTPDARITHLWAGVACVAR